jgi:hypothetical protein
VLPAAVVVSIVCGCVAAVTVQQIFHHVVAPWFALALGLICLANGTPFAFCGLESSLLLTLESLFLLSFMRKGYRVCAFVGALACLTRPDALLLVAPVLLCSTGPRNARCVAAFVLPCLAWLLFALVYYGDWLPQSFHAKLGAQQFWPSLGQLLRHLNTIPLSLLGLESVLELAGAVAAVCILNLILTLPTLFRPDWRRIWVLLYAFIAYPWILIAAYSFIGPPAGHYWEVHSALFFNQLALALGAVTLVNAAVQSASRTAPLLRKPLHAMVVSTGIWLVIHGMAAQLDGPAREQEQRFMGARHRAYVQVANWLRANASNSSILAMAEPGTIAYLTGLRVVDLGTVVSRSHRIPDLVLMPGHVRMLGGWASPWRVSFEQVQFFPSMGYMPLSLLRRSTPARQPSETGG